MRYLKCMWIGIVVALAWAGVDYLWLHILGWGMEKHGYVTEGIAAATGAVIVVLQAPTTTEA